MGRGTVVGRVGPPVPTSLKCCQTCIVNPLLTDVLRFCVTRWSVLFRIALWGLFFGRYRFFYWFFRSCFVNIQNSSSSAVQLDIKGAFHFPRNSANSGWDANGTHVFQAFQWKVARNKWNFEKIVLFSRWKLSGGNAWSIYEFSQAITSSRLCRAKSVPPT